MLSLSYILHSFNLLELFFIFFIVSFFLIICTVSKFSIIRLKQLILFLSLIIFFFSVNLWILYDPFSLNFQWIFSAKFFSFHFFFGIDGLSLFFFFLTSFLIPVCILYGWNNVYYYATEYLIALFCMELVLLSFFTSLDLIMFYIFFESILIPLFIFIGLYGSRKRKLHASYFLFFYTLFGSLLMLFSILVIYFHTGTTDLLLLYGLEFSLSREKFIWFLFFISFAIKIPMFPFHIWLPEAHVEAPTEGSVLLAGILLKLGGYGFLRVLIPLFMNATLYFLPFVFTLALVSILYTSLVTLRQIDLKRVIAYSSIAHMNLAVIGLFSFSLVSISGGILLMISHGFISSALFFLIGMVYDRYKTRLIKYYNGLVGLMPLYISFLFFFIVSNISFPGTSSFIAELFICIPLFQWSGFLLIFSTLSFLFCTIYSILLYNRISFGVANVMYIRYGFDLTRLEFHVLLPLAFFVLVFGLFPNLILSELSSYLYFFFF
jgi:NADH-ubiquinone oxidoreductase chain 4